MQSLNTRLISTATLMLMTGFFLVACGSMSTRFVTGLSSEQRAQAEGLSLYRETLAEGSYVLVGPAEGYSCQITRDDTYRPTEHNALAELRRAAVKAGGNAVMGVGCEPLGRGQSQWGCFRAIVCGGTVVDTNGAESR